jgi:hypothetical protein
MDTLRRSDAECGPKECRPKGGPEKARLLRCPPSAYLFKYSSVVRLVSRPFPAHRGAIRCF